MAFPPRSPSTYQFEAVLAANCCLVLKVTVVARGVMVTPAPLEVTLSELEPLTELETALIVVEPAATALAKPPEVTVATTVEEELQVLSAA